VLALLKKKFPRPGEGSSRRNASLGDFGGDPWPGTAENRGGGLEGGEFGKAESAVTEGSGR
jgi:hypothetical protein